MTKFINPLLEELFALLTPTESQASREDKYVSEIITLANKESAKLAEIGYSQTGEVELYEEIQPEYFASCRVFAVNSDTFHKCRLGKRRYARYAGYVGNDSNGATIREYGRSRHGQKGIFLVDNSTGAMIFLRRPHNSLFSK